LFYVAAVDFEGTLWDVPTLVDGVTDAGFGAKLFDVAGFPAIVYADEEYQALRYIRALDQDGKQWGEPRFLATRTTRLVGAAQMPDGRLAALFANIEGNRLNMLVSNDLLGESWSQAVPVKDAVSPGLSVGFTFVDEQPCIVYFEMPVQYTTLSFAAYY
jgi:hypothetical protein